MSIFKARRNRLCVSIPGHGLVPVAGAEDDTPIFLSHPPKKEGDDAMIYAEGKTMQVRLLKSERGFPFLVYMNEIRWNR